MEELLEFINSIHKIDVETEDAVRKYFVYESFKKTNFSQKRTEFARKLILFYPDWSGDIISMRTERITRYGSISIINW